VISSIFNINYHTCTVNVSVRYTLPMTLKLTNRLHETIVTRYAVRNRIAVNTYHTVCLRDTRGSNAERSVNPASASAGKNACIDHWSCRLILRASVWVCREAKSGVLVVCLASVCCGKWHTSARQLADPRIILVKVARDRDLPEEFWWTHKNTNELSCCS
jgi:hypothetical protein